MVERYLHQLADRLFNEMEQLAKEWEDEKAIRLRQGLNYFWGQPIEWSATNYQPNVAQIPIAPSAEESWRNFHTALFHDTSV